MGEHWPVGLMRNQSPISVHSPTLPLSDLLMDPSIRLPTRLALDAWHMRVPS